MKNKIEIYFDEFSDLSELNSNDREVVEASMAAAKNAYAPYSGFRVGACVRLENGLILKGNNRENAAFPSGSCAEQTVISYAGANYPDVPIRTLAISAITNNDFTPGPVSPCGNCRQIIAEEEDRSGKKIRIILYGSKKIQVIDGIAGLLPLIFNKKRLRG